MTWRAELAARALPAAAVAPSYRAKAPKMPASAAATGLAFQRINTINK
jgi:hypothetical protein